MPVQLLAALDEVTVKILAATSAGSTTAATMRDSFDIPESTLYRRLRTLVELDALREEHRLDDANNPYTVYRANLTRLCVTAEGGSGRVAAEFTDGHTRATSFESPG